MNDLITIRFRAVRDARRFFDLTQAPALAGRTCYLPEDYVGVQEALDYLGVTPKEIEWPDSRA